MNVLIWWCFGNNYLNFRNMIFSLGIIPNHLETAIATRRFYYCELELMNFFQ